MGLAGVKNRSKIGTDPNNTKWARNTNNYGQRILRQQGWEAGQYLGQKDASHAALYTAASASHIKAVMREDNLGIGAAGPGQNTANQCTGLDIFKDLLGRLNGKSEESIEEQRQVRETAKMTLYVERRWGPMRFVRGGLLIGDEIKEDEQVEVKPKAKAEGDETATTSTTTSTPSDSASASASSATVSEDEVDSDDSKAAKAARKKAKKEKKERKEEKKQEKKERKEKKEKSKKRKADDDEDASDDDDEKKSKKSKSEKKEKKDKKDKKEKKEKKDKSEKKDKKDKKRRKLDEGASDDMEVDAEETPAFSKPAAMVSSRHLARRRYINQKRAAVSDPNAIKQIFMIKA